MSRLPLPEPETLEPFVRDLHDGASPPDWSTRHVARAFNENSALLEDYLAFYYPWHSSDGVGVLDARLKELVRLRIATLNGCKTCKAARLQPDSVTEHEAADGVDNADKEEFSARERVALEFAEQMADDHFSFCEEDMARLLEHFNQAEFLELAMMTGQYIGFGRMLAMLQLEIVACEVPA